MYHVKYWPLTVKINWFLEIRLLFWTLSVSFFLTFWKVDLFLTVGVSRNLPPLTDVVSEMLFKQIQTLDNVQNWHVYCNTPLFRTSSGLIRQLWLDIQSLYFVGMWHKAYVCWAGKLRHEKCIEEKRFDRVFFLTFWVVVLGINANSIMWKRTEGYCPLGCGIL
jgi:hypothetical protein